MPFMSQQQKLTSHRVVQMLLAGHGIHPRKRWGQNFLIDENILGKIIASADLRADDAVLEIGGGLGTLTQQIAARAKEVVVVEIDPMLVPILTKNIEDFPNVRVVHGDILELDWHSFFGNKRLKCLGNLPYNITAPLFEKLIRSRQVIEQAIWMTQLEVAEKLTAQPGTRDSSSLGVFVQAYCDARVLFKVSHNAFFPKPEVGSAVMSIMPLEQPRFHASDESFQKIVRAAFGMRRKTLYRALALAPGLGLPAEKILEILKRAGIDQSRRGETLTIAELDSIAQQLDE